MKAPLLGLTASLLILTNLDLQSGSKSLYSSKSFKSDIIGILRDNASLVLAKRPTIIPRPNKGELNDALKGFRTQHFQAGSVKYILNRDGIRHILQSHHPKYWDGSEETLQTFFDENWDVNDIVKAIKSVVRENRDLLKQVEEFKQCQVTGTVGFINRKTYVLGVKQGRLIGQFFPKHKNYQNRNPCP